MRLRPYWKWGVIAVPLLAVSYCVGPLAVAIVAPDREQHIVREYGENLCHLGNFVVSNGAYWRARAVIHNSQIRITDKNVQIDFRRISSEWSTVCFVQMYGGSPYEVESPLHTSGGQYQRDICWDDGAGDWVSLELINLAGEKLHLRYFTNGLHQRYRPGMTTEPERRTHDLCARREDALAECSWVSHQGKWFCSLGFVTP